MPRRRNDRECLRVMAEEDVDPEDYNSEGCESDRFRFAMGQFATGVAVVTAFDSARRPCGMTVNSLTSVSLTPPLLLYGLGVDAVHFKCFAAAELFALSILRRDQEMLSNRFADASQPGWPAELAWAEPMTGVPALKDAAITIVCRQAKTLELADHLIVFGHACAILGAGGDDPLVYHAGAYKGLGVDPKI